MDPIQADKFKSRNQTKGSSCCSSQKISISDSELTQNEKWLKEMLTPAFLTQHIDTILTLCAEKHENIIEKGRSDKLEINDQVEKFILDKVLPECVNQFIYEMLAVKVKKNGVSLNKEIGLWATPATWMQKYPKSQLDSLPSQYFG